MEEAIETPQFFTVINLVLPLVGVLNGAGAVFLAAWFQAMREDRRRRQEYLRAIRNEPLDKLRFAIDKATEISVHADRANGWLLSRDDSWRGESPYPTDLSLEVAVAIEIATNALSIKDVSNEVITDLGSMYDLGSKLFRHFSEGFIDRNRVEIEKRWTPLSTEKSELLLKLENHYQDLKLATADDT